jgi:hypothetical protein
LSFALLLLAPLLVSADPPPPADAAAERSRQEEVARIAPAQARALNLLSGESRTVESTLHAEPLLRWSNPTAGSVYGEVFLWTLADRPVAIASIYRWYHPFKDSTAELVSVSEQGIEATEGRTTRWDTKSPGIRFSDLPEAPRPAATAGGRLVQMRSLARRFGAELVDTRGGEQVGRELRLLNQPAHRYASPDQKVLDGGLFAFVEGTDPEAWIILEAFRTDAGEKWRYALARMNRDALQIKDGERIVQRWDHLRDTWTDRTTSYVTFNFDPSKLQLDLPAASPARPTARTSP